LRAKHKTKAMWQIMNKEVGNCMHQDHEIDLKNGNEIISIPQKFFG
jgi:hypothetical protein